MNSSSAVLQVTAANNNLSYQDLGRKSAQAFGFSVAGAADEYAYCLANSLVRNKLSTTALEITLGKCTFKALQDCEIAITGADCLSLVDQERAKHNQAFILRKGQTLTLNTPQLGIFTYLSIRGGLQTKQWQNSVSQIAREQVFGLTASQITDGSTLFIGTSEPYQRDSLLPLTAANLAALDETTTVRFIPTTLYKSLPLREQLDIEQAIYRISPSSDRMGYRVTSETKVSFGKNKNLRHLSMPVTAGMIQISNDGLPIILMKDSQTIGGYPVLGSVMKTDLFRLAQLRPGQSLKFVPCSLQFALTQLEMFYAKF